MDNLRIFVATLTGRYALKVKVIRAKDLDEATALAGTTDDFFSKVSVEEIATAAPSGVAYENLYIE